MSKAVEEYEDLPETDVEKIYKNKNRIKKIASKSLVLTKDQLLEILNKDEQNDFRTLKTHFNIDRRIKNKDFVKDLILAKLDFPGNEQYFQELRDTYYFTSNKTKNTKKKSKKEESKEESKEASVVIPSSEEFGSEKGIILPDLTTFDKFTNYFNKYLGGKILYNNYNYLGPGTDVKSHLDAGLEPTNELDALAYQHDLDYVAAGKFSDRKQQEKKIDIDFIRDLETLHEKVKKEIETENDYNKKRVLKSIRQDTINTIHLMKAKNFFGASFIGETESLNTEESKKEESKKEESKTEEKPIKKLATRIKYVEPEEMKGSEQAQAQAQAQALDPLGAMAPVIARPIVHSSIPVAPPVSEARVFKGKKDKANYYRTKAIKISGQGQLSVDLSKLTEEEMKLEQEQQKQLGIKAKEFKLERVRYSDTVVTGERSMRAAQDKRLEGSYVELKPEEKARNIAFYSSLNWVKEGNGNGNQQILPGRTEGWKAKNKLIDARIFNQKMRYSGHLNIGNMYCQPIVNPTNSMRRNKETLMTPQNQVNQKMFPQNPYKERPLGEKIQMSNNRQTDSYFSNGSNYAKNSSLYFLNYVNGGIKI